MAYYQGDYYQGDYYQGDPFFGALLGLGASWLGKKLLGKGAAAAGKTAIARVGAGAITGAATGAAVTGLGATIARFGPGLFRAPSDRRPLPIDLTVRGKSGLTSTLQAGPGMCCPSGYHLNKGPTSMGHPPGTTCVKNRSMNVANPRALRRSLRRVAGFGKLAQRARKDINRAARAVGK